jgi:protoporphyrin/coproporphyrin ferrochelatase
MKTPSFPADRLDPALPTGLILCGMGGPDKPDDVVPFLRNLFADPRIIPIPRLVAPIVARLIAHKRGPVVRERYGMISPDGGSPQLSTTRRQAEALAERAATRNTAWLPAVAMRYWHPFPDETVVALHERGAVQYLVVPMYPQYADATSGNTLEFVLNAIGRLHPEAPVHVLPAWGTLPGFTASLAAGAANALQAWSDHDPAECALLFVAHSLPEKHITAGDPYLDQTRATVDAVHGRIRDLLGDQASWLGRMPGGATPLLAFQSRVGPIKWLGPEIGAETTRLARAGCRRLHVQPVSFTCEHIETRHELDIELKETAATGGITHFSRGPALNLDTTWLDSLADHLLHIAHRKKVTSRA